MKKYAIISHSYLKGSFIANDAEFGEEMNLELIPSRLPKGANWELAAVTSTTTDGEIIILQFHITYTLAD